MDVHWVVAGQPDESGELYAQLQAQADRLGVSKYAHFVGFVDEPERFFNALDGFLLCSRTEGHPLALCQAMVCGLPIVATACGAEAAISDGIQGWVVPVGAVDALASAVKEIANNTQEAARRGQRARARGLSDFDSRTTDERYLEIYRRAMVGPPTHGEFP
jgi:glycosyltransferase involved in cell wall biosynthesis